MSGHSKWSTIKRQKGAQDQKRGALFTKLSNAITVAVKQGGGIADPDSNFRLRLAVDAARTANMPKDNIDRAIQRAAGKDADLVVEQVYEGFGPGGFSVIVEALTDNTNRTSPEIKSMFEKNGGNFATPGAVSYQFELKGELVLSKDRSLDDVFVLAYDSGAEDVEEKDDVFLVYTKPEDLKRVKDHLSSENLPIENASVVRKPTLIKEFGTEDEKQKAMAFLEMLEDHPDVSDVYANVLL